MKQSHFLKRELAELKAAKSAVSSEARLAHLEMAYRYGVKALGVRDAYSGKPLSVTHRAAAARCRQLAVSVTTESERTFLDHASILYDEMATTATKCEHRLDAPR